MPNVALGSLLVGSSDVDRMKAWYRDAFGASEDAMGGLDLGGPVLFIESHTEVSGPAKDPARIIINLHVDDARSLYAHMDSLGTRWVRELDEQPFGIIATAADPDGNYVQIIQWGAAPEEGHGG